MSQKLHQWIDFLDVVMKRRRLVVINFLAVSILAAVFSLILPKVYRAQTTILPPAEEGDAFGLSSLISKMPLGSFGLDLGGVSEETYSILAVLKSRTIMESAAGRFDLMNRYKAKDMEYTVKKLRENVSTKVNDDGTITIAVKCGTSMAPNKAKSEEAQRVSRDMANFFVAELDRLNKRLKTERARNFRGFIEKRFFQNVEDLHNAEEALKRFQQANGAISLPDQVSAMISATSKIRAEIMAKEMESGVLEQTFSSDHPEALRIRTELRELNKKYGEITRGDGGSPDRPHDDLFLPLHSLPDIGIQYARLYRDVLLQEKLMEFLLPQYEQAKIQEAKDMPTVQVLDEAVIPIKRIKPKRAFFVLLWAAISLFVSVSVILTREYLERLRKTDERQYGKLIHLFRL
jgi:tyrosine-protein kinase Etk/Wzc